MRAACVIALIVCIFGARAASAIPMGPGDSLTFEFDFTGNPGTVLPVDRLDLIFAAEGLTVGEGFTLDWFDDAISPSIFTEVFVAPFTVVGGSRAIFTATAGGLTDAIGLITLSNVVGNFEITDLSMTTGTLGNPGTTSDPIVFDLGVVPEPATLLLVSTGLAGLAGFERRRKWR